MYIVIGLLLVGMALAGSVFQRLPVSTAMLYLAVGVALGPHGAAWLDLDPLADARFLERVTEAAVIMSLFTAGLKLRVPVRDALWRPAFRLAFVSMLLTVALVALSASALLGLSAGSAILLGAILAPTDPVLASDVQVADPEDRDRLRFTLTAEAGLNDGTAFPFVLLGLGLVGLRDLGADGVRWLLLDVLWAVPVGLVTGWTLGAAIGRLVVYLRREYRAAVGLDEFLTLGLIALAYGVGLALHAYGFLSVFAAGLALRRIEQRASGDAEAGQDEVADSDEAEAVASPAAATDPARAPGYMARALLGFNEQLERIGEVAVVLVLGVMLTADRVSTQGLWLAALLFLAIRPASVLLGLAGAAPRHAERRLMAWFGIRGIGSLYYLFHALSHGLPPGEATTLATVTLTIVAASVIVHGISATPLMQRYEAAREAPAARSA